MLGLKSKNAPKEKVHGARALTPSEWRHYLLKRTGEYVVIGGRPGSPYFVSEPHDRFTAQRMFDRVVEECDFRAAPGYRVRIVAVER